MVEDLPEEWTDISIHALREEGDDHEVCLWYTRCAFLSTPSARRATVFVGNGKVLDIFLSTPSARRATLT